MVCAHQLIRSTKMVSFFTVSPVFPKLMKYIPDVLRKKKLLHLIFLISHLLESLRLMFTENGRSDRVTMISPHLPFKVCRY